MRNLSDAAKKKQTEAQREWHKKNTEYLNVGLRKGARARYNLLAEHRGVSLASIIKNHLDEECRKEFGDMLLTFVFEGQEGQLFFDNIEQNEYGNICGRFTWGEIVEYPTFRSLEQAKAFVADEYELECYIDQACHA